MKRVVLLGSTGSIGRNTLRVAETLPSEVRVVGLAVLNGWEDLLEQAQRHKVTRVAVADGASARACSAAARRGMKVYAGPAGLEALVAETEAELVVCAVVGMAGLQPVLAAVRWGRDVALATKEVLVAAGEPVTAAARGKGVRILPIDSEHSAILQCLGGRMPEGCANGASADVRRLVLTASGGPFAFRPEIDFDRVSVREALRHPRWNMGRKVTIDSATLMNKGLEVLEAHWLFGVAIENIDVVLHPESIVHSLVEFVDGSMVAQLSPPDMRLAIQYALTFPARVDGGLPRLDLADVGRLHFHAPDDSRFPCLRLAREAGRQGGTMPAAMNAANEVAVQKFLDGAVPFSGIWRIVEAVMQRHIREDAPDLEAIVAADAWARRVAGEAAG